MRFFPLLLVAPALLGGLAMADVSSADFGAKADGVTDDTAALQAALDAAATKGPRCLLPPGQYRVDGALTVPAGVTLQGASGGVPHSEHPIGTVLLAYGGKGQADGPPLVTLKPNAVIRELIIHYPEQTLPDVVAYPWSIRTDGELCQIENIVLTNPYQALDLGTKWNELHTVRNVFACPLKIGVYIDQCSDIGRIENVHFNPNFWTRMALKPGFPKIADADNVLYAYLKKNLIGFKIGRTDWEYLSNCFVILAQVGYLFDDFGHGAGNAVLTQSGSDIGPCAVRVARTQPHAGAEFVNGQFMGTVEVSDTNQGPVKLTNCGFWPIAETVHQIDKRGPSTLMLTSCHFAGWDSAGKGEACIHASGGRLVVNGCDFMAAGKLAVSLDKGLLAAIFSCCLFRGDNPIHNQSDAEVKTDLNTTR
jgi:hypothetical protein